MSQSARPAFGLPVIAVAAITANRFITFGGAIPAAGAAGCGVARFSGVAGDVISTEVMGTMFIEAGAAVAAGVAVETDVLGRAITKNTGAALARSIEPAIAAGQMIECFLLPN